MNALDPRMAGRKAVHRHPRPPSIMKPPINGARSGPEKTVMVKGVMARPLRRLSNMSENTAATTETGQAPKKPLKNRQSMTV